MTTVAHRPLAVIGAAIGAGAPDERSADGPRKLLDGGLLDRLKQDGIAANWLGTHAAPRRADGADALTSVARLGKLLAGETERLTRERRSFVSLGGDHSAAIGLWSGVARAARPQGFGLIWIDAHMDAHTFATTPSRMIHGMPVASLLGHGDALLTGLAAPGAAVAPENLCLIGTRSWEDGEADLLRQLGVRIIAMPEVRARSFDAALAEAIAIATKGTGRFGVSIDIDAFDPAEITGTGLHVPDGLHPAEVLPALRRLRAQLTLAGIEIAEYNPHQDTDGATAKLIGDMIVAAFGAD